MTPSAAMLTQMSAGYTSLAEGVDNPYRTGMEGLPFVGQGGFGSLVGMAAAPKMFQAMGAVGMAPMGMGHDQNIYDIIRAQQFTALQMSAMQHAAESDRGSFMNSFRGVAAITGTPFGGAERQAANKLVNMAVTAAPALASFAPEFLDQLGGTKGSATVLAKHMIDAGRYRIDPVTGRMGLSAETVGQQSQALFQDLYSDRNFTQMHGLRAGQLGEVYQGLQAKGMLRTATSEKGTQGISGGDLDKMTLDPAFEGKLRSIDTERIKRSLKAYTGAIAAMRDIFGDNGQPNAPIQQLIAGLEAMTGGSVGQIDPGRLTALVRQTHNLARQTGIGLDNAMMIQQHAEKRAQDMGLEPIFGVTAAQGAMGFGGAYRAQGHAAHTAWGAFNADQVHQMDANLRVQAAGSNMANRLGAVMRMRDAVGGFEEGTEAHTFTQAIASGLDQYKDPEGNMRSVNIADDRLIKMMTGATGAKGVKLKLGEGDVRDMLSQQPTNREYVDRYKVADLVRGVQGRDELHPFVGYQMQMVLQARLRDQLGVDSKTSLDAASAVSQNTVKRMFEMSTKDFSGTATRNQGISDILESELTKSGHGDLLGKMDETERKAFLAGTAERFYGASNRAIPLSAFGGFVNLQNMHRLTNKTTLDEADRRQMSAAFERRIQESMAPLGHGTMMTRAVDALRDARIDDPNAGIKALAQTLGGVRIDDINKSLMKPMDAVNKQREAVEALQNKIKAESDPSQRSELMKQLEGAHRELEGQSTQLAQIGERFGFFADQGISGDELSRTSNLLTAVKRTRDDLTGVRTGAGGRVSKAEIDAAQGRSGPGSEMEAQAVLLARRMAPIDAMKHGKGTPEDEAALKHVMDSFPPGTPDNQRRHYGLEAMKRHAEFSMDDPNDHFTRSQLDDLRKNLTVRTEGEALALVRMNRRLVPSDPTAQEIRDVKIEHGDTITTAEANEMIAARHRATRMGIDHKKVVEKTGLSPADYKKPGAWQQQMTAINALIEEQEVSRYTVTEKQRAKYVETKTTDGKGLTQAQRDKYRKDHPGATDAQANTAILDKLVLGERYEETEARYKGFWNSADGPRFREDVASAQQEIANDAYRLGTKPSVRRLGTRAIEMAEELRDNQQKLQDLARTHAENDIARLHAGQYNLKTSLAPEQAADVRAKVNAIEARNKEIFATIQEQEGREGREGHQWQLGDRHKATESVLSTLPKARADEIRKTMLMPTQERAIEVQRQKFDSEADARAILGISATGPLTEWQKAKIQAVRHGVGNEAEVRAALGVSGDVVLSQADITQAQRGVNTTEAAKNLIRKYSPKITEAEFNDDEMRERIHGLQYGLTNDKHAEAIAHGIHDKTAAEKKADIESMHLGRGSYAFARKTLGHAADTMPAGIRHQIDTAMEAEGNTLEARRLLDLKPGVKAPDQGKLDAMTIDVGIARRMTPEDEKAMETRTKLEGDLASFMPGSSLSETKKFLSIAADGRLTDAQRAEMAVVPITLDAAGQAEVAKQRPLIADAEARSKVAKAKVADLTAKLRNKDKKLTPKDQEDFQAQLVEARKEQGAADTAVTTGYRALSGLATEAGATTTELLAGKRSGSKLEELTPEEAKDRTDANKDDAAATDRATEAAKRRGVTLKEYLSGRGFSTDPSRRKAGETLTELKKTDEDIGNSAKRLGVTGKDMKRAWSVFPQIDRRQDAAERAVNESPDALVRQLYKSFDVTLPADSFNTTQQELISKLQEPDGKALVRRIIGSQQTLKTHAEAGKGKGLAGIDTMVEAFRDIENLTPEKQKKATLEFQKKYGIEMDTRDKLTGVGNDQWQKLQDDISLQQQTKILQTGRRSGGTLDSDLIKHIGDAMRVGPAIMDKHPASTDTAPMRITGDLTGSLTIKGDHADFVGAVGGRRGFVA